ncbi:hypothetical protein FRC02_004276, partial [Tulasnella sp. 418]
MSPDLEFHQHNPEYAFGEDRGMVGAVRELSARCGHPSHTREQQWTCCRSLNSSYIPLEKYIYGGGANFILPTFSQIIGSMVLEYDSGRAGVEYGCWMCLKTSNGKAMMGRRLGIPWEGVTSNICTDEFWKSYIQSLSNVTHLQVSVRSYMFNYAESAGLMVAIDLMKALQHLEVEIIEDKEPYSSKEREITMMLPELRTFNLRLRKPCPSLWAWLKNLDVPSLSGLTIWHQAPHQSEEWHNRLDRDGWSTLRRAVKLPL